MYYLLLRWTCFHKSERRTVCHLYAGKFSSRLRTSAGCGHYQCRFQLPGPIRDLTFVRKVLLAQWSTLVRDVLLVSLFLSKTVFGRFRLDVVHVLQFVCIFLSRDFISVVWDLNAFCEARIFMNCSIHTFYDESFTCAARHVDAAPTWWRSVSYFVKAASTFETFKEVWAN